MGSLLIGNAQGSVERILFIDWFVALGLLALGPVTWDGMDMYMNFASTTCIRGSSAPGSQVRVTCYPHV